MIEAIKKLFVISRPISWPNTAYPFAAGYLVTGGTIDATWLVATAYFLIPYNLLMYGINDVFDYESDVRNPRKGGIEGAKEQKKFHPVIIWASVLTNLPFVAYLMFVGSVVSAAIFLALVFFVLAYSVKGLRFKELPLLDSITSSIHFVGPLVFALSLTHSLVPATAYLIAFFFWGMASHAFGAVQDIIPDREGGLASIATKLGAKKTVWFSFVLYGLSSVIVALQGGLSTIVGLVGVMYMANIYPCLRLTDASSGRANTPWRRFIYLNLVAGFVVTLVLISYSLARG